MADTPDVIVIGAALNGLAAALALAGRGVRRPLNVLVVDAKHPEAFANTEFDGRASAITAGSRNMFEALGIWGDLQAVAQPMNEIIVTDGAQGGGRPTLLDFGQTEMQGRPSAHMIENRHLYDCLFKHAKASPEISFATGTAVTAFTFGPGPARITLADGAEHRASLIVAGDGRNSRAREAAGIVMHGWAYGQTGIVVTVAHERPHHGRAEEHFTPSGPFAILPLPSNRSSLVWTERTKDAERILSLDDAGFLEELRRRFGDHLGEVTVESGRHGYPLGMWIAKEFTATRLALIGDAAHIVHPLAGLGFNLGLRDVAALAECVHDAVTLGLDHGGEAVLSRYAQWRRFDTVATAAAMDGLNRLFASDNSALRLIRDAGLLAVNKLPVLKSMFVNEAAGRAGTLPKLMRGEPL